MRSVSADNASGLGPVPLPSPREGTESSLAVGLPHDKIQRAENRDHVATHMAGQEVREHAQVHKRGRANLQPVRRPSSLAVDVKSQLALGIFGAEINFARQI